MTRRAMIRASDADRELVAERLRTAAAEGRLLAEELDDRLGAAFRARTYGELDVLVADLPRSNAVVPPRTRAMTRRPGVAVAAAVSLALLLLVGLASALGGHGHYEHHWDGGWAIWLVWLVIGWRVLIRRRGRSR